LVGRRSTRGWSIVYAVFPQFILTWLTPLIPGIWEAEIRKIVILGQPWQKVIETLSQ
jgi:hypothetical protein